MTANALWDQVQNAAGTPDSAPGALWAWLGQRLDLAHYRPQAAPGLELSRLSESGGVFYVLKNPAGPSYYRLGERDLLLWQRMDGQRTVKDLVVAYYLAYGSFAFARVAGLVQGLRSQHMLVDEPVDIYGQVLDQLGRRSPDHRVQQLWQAFLQKQFPLKGLDGLVTAIYRRGGWVAFTRPVQFLLLAVLAVGLVCFGRIASHGDFGVVTNGKTVGLGLATLVAANLVAIVLHELSHALTVKHFGREVQRGGFMLYFGLPAFFMDTSDIWMEDKRARLAVTWAGPHASLVLAGLASLAIWLWPASWLAPLLYQFAFVSYVTTLLNLNPLLELDGYYLLMDWLEIPMLRARSLAFIRNGLPAKFQRNPQPAGAPNPLAGRVTVATGTSTALAAGPERNSPLWTLPTFSREERIFTAFGLLSALWMGYAIFMGLAFWQARFSGVLRGLQGENAGAGRLLLALPVLAVAALFLLSMALWMLQVARRGAQAAVRRGWVATPWRLAAVLLVPAVLLSSLPVALDSPLPGQVLALAVQAAAVFLAAGTARLFRGAGLARFFRLLGAAAGTLFMGRAVALLATQGVLVPSALGQTLQVIFAGLGLAGLAAGGLVLLAAVDQQQSRRQVRLLAPGLALLCALGLLAAHQARVGNLTGHEAALLVAGTLLPGLALVGLLPAVASRMRTCFGPAWTVLAAGIGGLALAGLLSQVAPAAWALLALGSGLFLLEVRRLRYRPAAPETAAAPGDQVRLQRSFTWTVDGLLAQLQQMGGRQEANAVAGDLNRHARAAAWPLRLAPGAVEDSLSPDMALVDRGRLYGEWLNLLLDLVARRLGDQLTGIALQRAYDGLPWEEREVAAQYLFPQTARAAVLGREFLATRDDSLNLLRAMPLFSTMDDEDLAHVATRLRRMLVKAGQVMVRQGEPGDTFFVIRRGHVTVSQDDPDGATRVINRLERGDYFGELALLRDEPRSATCRAAVPGELLALSRQDFQDLVRQRFALQGAVDRAVARVTLLRRMPLFGELDGRQIQRLAASLEEVRYQAGDLIIGQGDLGDTFYIVLSGRVQVFVTEGDQEQTLRQSGPGEVFGEIALLQRVPRTASVRAVTPVELLALRQEAFDRLIREQVLVSRNLERESSRRMIHSRRLGAA